MQGIMTKKHGTFSMRAECEGKLIIRPRNDALRHDAQHREIALELATHMGWRGHWVGATVPEVKGVVWVCLDEKIPERQFDVPDGL